LRYKDLIEREAIGLAGRPWNELLAPFIVGAYSSPELFEEPPTVQHDQSIQLSGQFVFSLDDCVLMLQTAVLQSSDEIPKRAFLIDSDFFHESPARAVTIDNIPGTLDTLHKNSGALFRACIQEPLHAALGPNPIQS
jgi:uncharacterized protein (TIGR04255 family)